ncbi:MAG: hypothetical protein U9R37_08650 [Campylobacterota bacterium]|nr:hypothetical protein [Campylobacterota bacterium]
MRFIPKMEDKIVECRNCKSELKKGQGRCPYCGVLNPTVKVPEILITMFIIIFIMWIFTTFIK